MQFIISTCSLFALFLGLHLLITVFTAPSPSIQTCIKYKYVYESLQMTLCFFEILALLCHISISSYQLFAQDLFSVPVMVSVEGVGSEGGECVKEFCFYRR